MRLVAWSARLAAIAALAVIAAQPAAAQQTSSEISGYVKDAQGAVVPGVTVTVTYLAINLSRSAVSNRDGYFVLPSLPNGVCDVETELSGFRKEIRRGIKVDVAAKLRVDFALQVGGIEETVEVTFEKPPISTRPDVAQTVTSEQIRDIASDGRSFMQLVTLLPGVSVTDQGYEFGTSLRSANQVVNGTRGSMQSVTVDGGENQDAGSNTSLVHNVNVDAIDEFTVISEYSAEAGRAAGPSVKVSTKRGTNKLVGSVAYYRRNSDWKLDGKDFATGKPAVLNFNNVSWTLGGPVALGTVRDKLFFFAGQEWKSLENSTGMGQVRAVPSLREREGDFSQSSFNPRNPATGQPFPDRIIPPAMISPLGHQLVNLFPLPDTADGNRATYTAVQDRSIRQDIGRLDFKTSATSNLTFSYTRDNYDQIEPYGSFGGGIGNTNFPLVPTSHARKSDTTRLMFTHQLGRSMIHEILVQGQRNNQDLLRTGTLHQRSGYTGPELFPSNRSGSLPDAVFRDTYESGSSGMLGQDYPTHVIGNYYTFKNTVTWIRANHNVKFGTYFVHNRKSEEIRRPDAGEFTFRNSGSRTGVAIADALLGYAYQYQESDRAPLANMRYNQFEVFAHDHWQARPNLSLDLGARLYWMGAPYERDDMMSTFDPALYDPAAAPRIDSGGNLVAGTGSLDANGFPTTGIALAGSNGVPRGLYSSATKVAPRFGFNWDPTSSGTFAVRGGFGIYEQRETFNSTRDQAASPPFVRTLVFTSSGSSPVTLQNPGGGVASRAPVSGFEALDRTWQTPTIYQWSLGVQKTLPARLVADINWVQNKQRHLLRVQELNFVEPDPVTGLAPTPTNANRPYLGYGRISINETTGNANYKGLQVAVNRRGTAASFGVSYTLSWARTDAHSEDSTSTSNMAQDPRHPELEWGFQQFDRRHVLAVNYILRLPFYTKQEGALGRLLGGWELSGVARLYSGQRQTPTAGTDSAIFGDTVQKRPNIVPGVDPYLAEDQRKQPTGTFLFNGAAFSAPAANELGNAPRFNLQMPFVKVFDVSLFKTVKLAHDVSVQLRIEAFNVFNIENYLAVETSATSTSFGQVQTWQNPRVVQLGARLAF